MTQEEHDRRVAATKHMTEFVIKIDNCFAAPTMNTGVFLKINDDPYLVINTEDFGAFLTTEQLVTIERCIKDNNPALINKINPYVRCVKCPEFFDINALKTDPSAKIVMAVFLISMYKALPHTEVGKAEYSNFASRFHVYFTGVPAGLNVGTTILLNRISNSPKDWHTLPDNQKYVLVGFYPDHKKLIVRTITNSINLVVDPSHFTLVEEMDTLSAGIARTLVGIIGHHEKVENTYKQVIISLKNKLPKEEPKVTKEEVKDAPTPPATASLLNDKNTSVTKKKTNTDQVKKSNKKSPAKTKKSTKQ